MMKPGDFFDFFDYYIFGGSNGVLFLLLFLFPLVLVGVESHEDFRVHVVDGGRHHDKVSSQVSVAAAAAAATLNMEGRVWIPSSSSNGGGGGGGGGGYLRKCVLVKLADLTLSGYLEMLDQGIGALLILMPPPIHNETYFKDFRELESHWREVTNNKIPIFMSGESEELLNLYDDLYSSWKAAGGYEGTPRTNPWDLILNNIFSWGSTLVTSPLGTGKVISKDEIPNLVSGLKGRLSSPHHQEQESLGSILIVSHYDSPNLVPGLSYGGESSASSVALFLELARLFKKFYGDSRTHPPVNLIFLLSGGGHMNYFGTKKWLEEHQDLDQTSQLLSNVDYVLCLEGLGKSDKMNMHVSKPPKENTPASKFFKALKQVAEKGFGMEINMVHKKINLADDNLAWEHERFSIRRLPAFTLSHFDKYDDSSRHSILDRGVDPGVVSRNARVIAEALACTIYAGDLPCNGRIFGQSLTPTEDTVAPWLRYLTENSRSSSLLLSAGSNNKNSKVSLHPVVETLKTALKSYTHSHNFKIHYAKKDKREPEFIFYDDASYIMSAYKVKPAMFDLVLTIVISGYLSLVYLLLIKMGSFISYFKNSYQQSSIKADSNGNTKVKVN